MIGKGEIEDFEDTIKSLGRKKEEFELSESQDPIPTAGVHPLTGIVTIKNKITGSTKTYRCGHGSHWVVDFEDDLKKGVF